MQVRVIIFAVLAIAACAIESGCQNTPSERTASAPLAVGVETSVEPHYTPSRHPEFAPSPVARLEDPSEVAHAVYTPPKIVKTVLAAYEDEKGRLFGPQEMYEKIEEGRFNVGALENPELAYIPQENLVVPPGMGNPVAIPAMRHHLAEAEKLPTDSLDARDIVPTGLFSSQNNQDEAERLAQQAGKRALFDPDLGWILVPPLSTP